MHKDRSSTACHSAVSAGGSHQLAAHGAQVLHSAGVHSIACRVQSAMRSRRCSAKASLARALWHVLSACIAARQLVSRAALVIVLAGTSGVVSDRTIIGFTLVVALPREAAATGCFTSVASLVVLFTRRLMPGAIDLLNVDRDSLVLGVKLDVSRVCVRVALLVEVLQLSIAGVRLLL